MGGSQVQGWPDYITRLKKEKNSFRLPECTLGSLKQLHPKESGAPEAQSHNRKEKLRVHKERSSGGALQFPAEFSILGNSWRRDEQLGRREICYSPIGGPPPGWVGGCVPGVSPLLLRQTTSQTGRTLRGGPHTTSSGWLPFPGLTPRPSLGTRTWARRRRKAALFASSKASSFLFLGSIVIF